MSTGYCVFSQNWGPWQSPNNIRACSIVQYQTNFRIWRSIAAGGKAQLSYIWCVAVSVVSKCKSICYLLASEQIHKLFDVGKRRASMNCQFLKLGSICHEARYPLKSVYKDDFLKEKLPILKLGSIGLQICRSCLLRSYLPQFIGSFCP